MYDVNRRDAGTVCIGDAATLRNQYRRRHCHPDLTRDERGLVPSLCDFGSAMCYCAAGES
jgi:hypothetical protein